MKVLVTGSAGFIGKNLVARLMPQGNIEVLPVTRAAADDDLEAAVKHADVVFHLAGVNRPLDTAEFVAGNTGLTRVLCAALLKTGRKIPVVYSSTIQAELDNPYGSSKRQAEVIIEQYGERTESPVYIYRLPNVFGKWCRPNYNSVVATFCHNIANGLPITINDANSVLSLVYIDDVIESFSALITTDLRSGGWPRVRPTYQISVGDLSEAIKEFKASTATLRCGRVGAGLARALYATFVSYLPTRDFSYTVPLYSDARGIFVEMLKTEDSGQFSYFTTRPGVTRGEHFHHTKTEKFLVLVGQARFRFRNVLNNDTHEVTVTADTPTIVHSVPGWAHDVTNVGDTDMVVMLWANEIFSRERPDTFPHRV